MQLNFRQLEVFRAIMVAKTISGAAEMLHVSQPGISRLLKYMEYKLDTALFERHKGRLIPTPEAEKLFKELDPVFNRLEELDSIIERIKQPCDETIRIACTPSLANHILPLLLAKIKQKFHEISIHLESLSNEEIFDCIIQRRIDFALAFYSTDHPLLLAEPSISLKMECVLPQSHPLANRKSLSFKEMLKYQIISYYPETLLGKKFHNACEKMNKNPEVSVMVRYADDACAMAEQGLGITYCYQYTALPGKYPGLKSIPLRSEKQQLHFIRHNALSMSGNHRQIYELAKTELKRIIQ